MITLGLDSQACRGGRAVRSARLSDPRRATL